MKKIFLPMLILTLFSGIVFGQAKQETKKVKPATQQANAAVVKKDGTLDKRFKENKKLKKDGTPDKRFNQNKKY